MSLIQKHGLTAREKGVCEILVSFLEDSGYLKYLTKNNESDKIELLNQFYQKLKSFEESLQENKSSDKAYSLLFLPYSEYFSKSRV